MNASEKRFKRIMIVETVRNPVQGRFSSGRAETLLEQDGELSLGYAPFARRHFSLLCGQVQPQEQELQGALAGGKGASGSDHAAQLGIQAFSGVRDVNHPLSRKAKNGITSSSARTERSPVFLSPRAIGKGFEL
jgi:hypothetical protein